MTYEKDASELRAAKGENPTKQAMRKRKRTRVLLATKVEYVSTYYYYAYLLARVLVWGERNQPARGTLQKQDRKARAAQRSTGQRGQGATWLQVPKFSFDLPPTSSGKLLPARPANQHLPSALPSAAATRPPLRARVT